jgi:ketosteroid isomerase-like protein
VSGEAKAMVLDIFERWNEGQREFDQALFAPDIGIFSAMTSREFRGEDGLRTWVAEIDEQFAVWGLDIDGIDEPVEGTVIAYGHIRGEGRGSGVAFEQPASWLIEVRAGKLMELHTFLGPRGAAEHLEAREG